MKKLALGVARGGSGDARAAAASAADKPLIGIVSISATEANNARYIQGATKAADELGWQVNVVDAAGNADQANAAIQNFAQLGAHAIVDMVFPWSSIGAGLDAAAAAGIPVVTWGGGLGGTVAATNGSGGPMAIPVVELMVEEHGGQGLHPRAYLSHRRSLPEPRSGDGRDRSPRYPDIKVTKNEVRIPGYFEDGAQYANAWLASPPGGQREPGDLGLLG